MGLLGSLGDIFGGIAGLKSDKKKNKRASEELALERSLANQQIDISKYIQDLSKQVVSRGSGITDPYSGQTSGYDPVTGTYKGALSEGQRAVQGASDQEELARNTVDQEMRRRALQDAEKNRQLASGQVGPALTDLNLFKQGVGAVNPEQIASSLRLSRTGAVNAGYDDAARSASMLGARTGSSAVADALAGLGARRAQTIAQTAGTPDVEGLQTADEINKSRLGQKVGLYDLFNTNANKVYDSPFTPSTAGNDAYTKALQGQQLDLTRFSTAMGGSGTAAAGIGSAAATDRGAYGITEGNRVAAPTGKFIGALGNNLDSLFGGNQGSSGGGINPASFAQYFAAI